MRATHPLLCITFLLGITLLAGRAAADPAFSVVREDDRVNVLIDQELYTAVIHRGFKRPILYPVIGPRGTPMTRDFPIKRDNPLEARDHPHHTSLYFAHGRVNERDFWHDDTVTTTRVVKADVEDNVAVITLENRWPDPATGNNLLTDTTTLKCFTAGGKRFIEYHVRLTADGQDVVLGDTKEGTMAIRTHPYLRLTGKKTVNGQRVARGQAINSEGDTDRAVWGKKARWVDYWAPFGEHTLGVAVFDHPTNLRHPTTWHARDYGLITANPFGLHAYLKKPRDAGNFTLKASESLSLRYLFVFHEGDAETAKIDATFDAWTHNTLIRN